jgi:hypothetical protein
MKNDRVDSMIRHALAVASEADNRNDRELGTIHLLKYLYLGDLAFAEQNGVTYSETIWTFHKFGPWSADLYLRVDPAVHALGAIERHLPSRYRDDRVRWSLNADPDVTARELPPAVARAIGLAVKAYHNDTHALLQHVYRTPPMLAAAPREVLTFQRKEGAVPSKDAGEPVGLPKVSKTQLRRLREKVQANLAARREQRNLTSPVVEYDQDYFEILDLLDRDAGSPVEESSGALEFSDDVWKSSARRDFGIS